MGGVFTYQKKTRDSLEVKWQGMGTKKLGVSSSVNQKNNNLNNYYVAASLM